MAIGDSATILSIYFTKYYYNNNINIHPILIKKYLTNFWDVSLQVIITQSSTVLIENRTLDLRVTGAHFATKLSKRNTKTKTITLNLLIIKPKTP